GSASYNMADAVRLRGDLDVGVLERALTEIVSRHEVLRTVLVAEGGQARQLVRDGGPVRVPGLDVSGDPDPQGRARVLAEEWAAEPFDLAEGPLFRVRAVRLAPGDHVLVVMVHHVVWDGWSSDVFARELNVLYGAFTRGLASPLKPLPVQYADFAVWQREWVSGEVLESQLEYWRERLAGAPRALHLNAGRSRPPVAGDLGETIFFEVDARVTAALRALSRERGVTLFMVLLAAYQVVLARFAGTADVVTGIPTAGRVRSELEDLIGFFVNTLVIRTDCSGDPAFTGILERVRQAALGAYANQDLPFEYLVEKLAPERDISLSRNPLVQVMFQLLQYAPEPLQLAGLEASDFPYGDVTT